MNKRRAKKIKQREFIKLVALAKEDDYMLFEYDNDKITLQEVKQSAEQFKKVFGNKIVFISKGIKLLGNSKDTNDIVEHLETLIKKLRGEINE